MSRVHAFRSRSGAGAGANTVCGGRGMGRAGEGALPSTLLVDAVGVIVSPPSGRALGVGAIREGVGSGLARPDWGAVSGVFEPDLSWVLYSMILKMLVGSLLEVITVVTPAAVAMSAAMSFVSIPPVPRFDPSVVVLTEVQVCESALECVKKCHTLRSYCVY